MPGSVNYMRQSRAFERSRTRALSTIKEQKWGRLYCAEALAEQGGKCCYCHEPLTCKTATTDHIRARMWGGETSKANIAAACLHCNKTKGSLTPNEFLSLIKNPHGHDIDIWLVWSRRKIWLATNKTCGRIGRMVA